MKLFPIVFVLAMSVCACSSSNPVRPTDYETMNEALRAQMVTIELRDGGNVTAKNPSISGDSVSWLNTRTGQTSHAGIRQIKKIVNKNHFRGGMEGMGIGLFIGGGVGALVGSALNIRSTAESGSQTSGFGALVGLVLGGGTGAVVGLATGLISGHSNNYEFSTAEQSDSLRNGK